MNVERIVNTSEVKVFQCWDCKKGRVLSTEKISSCNWCGSMKQESKRRFSFWDTLCVFVKSRGGLLILDPKKSRVSKALQWAVLKINGGN